MVLWKSSWKSISSPQKLVSLNFELGEALTEGQRQRTGVIARWRTEDRAGKQLLPDRHGYP